MRGARKERLTRTIIVVAALTGPGPALADPLYCSTWQGIHTCSSPDGYVSHETQWQGRTNGWDNRGDTWSTRRWRDNETTTITPERR
jgi:hypothetical protein